MKRLRRQDGFSLVELMVTMIVSVMTLIAATQIFAGLLRGFKQQSRIAETNVEGIVGLELARQDLLSAGYGLPWVVTGVVYNEVTPVPGNALNDSPSDAPRPFVNGDGEGFNGSDYLAVKASLGAMNAPSEKWTTLRKDNVVHDWPDPNDQLAATDGVIVVTGGGDATDVTRRTLVVSGTFYTTFNNTSPFAPIDNQHTNIIYGIDTETPLRAPFNRADYFIDTTAVPERCAPDTGVIVKAVMSHSDGNLSDNQFSILECVADMQVIFRLDTNNDDAIDSGLDELVGMDAPDIREQVKEVRMYILTHEGRMDPDYTHENGTFTVGEFGLGRDFDLTTIPGWEHYRWRLHTLAVRPENLGAQ
jgi:prepilin-type N-terminal cleavage/methylation domain-containing protein